ncbi:hypothetical protein VV089_17830 [Candidatus Merdisoma sp. JLR.KK011]|uniref:hypothetical protein n=1 Tax=Candidatus Merdisoma sp. JLR.KK011 TaxID=3114299 RepID=UPI002FF3BD45
MLPARSKKEVEVFDISEKSIESFILCKQNKKYKNLGAQLSFFTSLDEEKSLSIDFSVGRSNGKFNNTMVISLPVNFTSSKLIGSIGLLKDLIKKYKAFYACFTSNINLKQYDDFYDFDSQIPKVVFWVNYWGEDIINNFKINEKMLEICKCKSRI